MLFRSEKRYTSSIKKKEKKYKCKACGKSYTNYGSLYKHKKRFHPRSDEGGFSNSRSTRGRPKKIKNGYINPELSEYFTEETRKGGPVSVTYEFEEVYKSIFLQSTKLYKCFTDHPLFRILERVENFIDILEDNRNLKNSALEEAKLRSNISSIHEQYDETKNLDLKKDSDSIEKDTPEKNISIKIKEDSNLNNHFRKETEEEKSIRLKNLLIRQQTSCDKVFVRYLASVSRVVNQEYYKKVLSFVLLLRECINENAIFLERKRLTPNDDIFPREEERGRTKKEYCRFRNAEMIPEIFNEFLDNYVKKKIGIMLAINEISELSQNFSSWLLIEGYSCLYLKVINRK